jgi:alpha-galactosidase
MPPPVAIAWAVLCQVLVGAVALAAESNFAPGIARPALPPMGWRSWNWFACDVNQTIMEQQAAAMAAVPSWASKSLLQLGYSHIGLDDCWQSCTGPKGSFHDLTTGDPIVNTTAFPSLAAMVSHAAALGLQSGFYGDNCRCHVGERQVGVTHYAEDVALTLEAGFAGTKIDSCGNQRDMTKYAELFAAANRTILVESCGNGPAGTEPKRDLPPQAAYLEMLEDTCPWSLYRVSVDLGPTFLSTVYNVNRGLPFLKRGPGTVPLSRPGCWMYPDMMMVGVTKMRQDPREPPMPVVDPNPMTPTEWRTHFAMWAVTSSPLILGFDLTNDTMLRAAWPIIANEEALAVSQSWSGHPGFLVANSSSGILGGRIPAQNFKVAWGRAGTHYTNASLPSWQVWAKPLKDNGMAVLVVRVWESEDDDSRLVLPFSKLWQSRLPASVTVRDIHAHTDNGTASTVLTVNLLALPERGSFFLVLTPTAVGASPSQKTDDQQASTVVSVDASKVTHQLNPLHMGCHSDSGFAHQPRGFYSQLLYGESFEFGNASSYDYQSSIDWFDHHPTAIDIKWNTLMTQQAAGSIRFDSGVFAHHGFTSLRAEYSTAGKGGGVFATNRGIGNEGLYLLSGKDYEGYFFAKSELPTNVTVMLRNHLDGTAMASASIMVNSPSEWTQYNFSLAVSSSVKNASCEGITPGSDPTISCHLGNSSITTDPQNDRQGHVCIRCAGEFAIGLTAPGVVHVDYVMLQPGRWGAKNAFFGAICIPK